MLGYVTKRIPAAIRQIGYAVEEAKATESYAVFNEPFIK